MNPLTKQHHAPDRLRRKVQKRNSAKSAYKMKFVTACLAINIIMLGVPVPNAPWGTGEREGTGTTKEWRRLGWLLDPSPEGSG